MAQNRKKQREHRKCGMTKDERLKMEAAQRDAEQAAKEKARREELLDRVDFCGIASMPVRLQWNSISLFLERVGSVWGIHKKKWQRLLGQLCERIRSGRLEKQRRTANFFYVF